MPTDRLTICFIPWLLFNETDRYADILSEVRERGFNCIRFDDGAGFLWKADGTERENVKVHAPFGKYTKYTTYKTITNGTIRPLERLLKICRTASQFGIRVILCSWFYLHTNWFFEYEETRPYFALSAEEKIAFFSSELDRILSALRREGLLDTVAFAELFNEFDGIPWFRGSARPTPEEAAELRTLHEQAIAALKEHHPEVLFAFDTLTPTPMEELIPRNADVFDFHFYYAWGLYNAFEQNLCRPTLEEPVIPEETRYFLKKDNVSVKDVAAAMNGDIRTGLDWPRRISLYASIDPAKEGELNELLEKSFQEKAPVIQKNIVDRVEKMLEIHDRIIPNSRIVMGEGVTYCASPTLTFEATSKVFWSLIEEHMRCYREKGFWGSVISTTHAPDRSAAWGPCKEIYIDINKKFSDEFSLFDK